ncbi:phosphorothioated DNA-binding restriction endonuclease [Streptomyces sp. ST2-7A]|uniref:phosphorothioated DNA-binding restriction endonuclease n=1 Tax=Streptomyces sp. ST2-7A TaxID=2907214 RepID=UPI001F33EEC0|nr:HNH endonuclease [Streptomyces sp. ST2-7A]MCE7083011.1 HNH endonuclease [Streptomyces sp. ST2-7A]
MERDELFGKLAKLRRAVSKGHRAPHKPLMLLWLINRFAERGTTEVAYEDLAGPLRGLIEEFGPPAASPVDRPAMPFVHLERELWCPVKGNGEPIPAGGPRTDRALRGWAARGRLLPEVETLLADPAIRAEAVGVLIDHHFTPAWEEPLLAAVGGGLTALETDLARMVISSRAHPRRDPRFALATLKAWARACAMCGYDGRIDGLPVGLEAAHIKWHSHLGPATPDNGLALCALHHGLFDRGALGLTPEPEPRIRVSPRYTASGTTGRAVLDLHGAPLRRPEDPKARPAAEYLAWHDREVFRRAPAGAGVTTA